NVTAVLYKLDRSLDRAARSLGAGPLRTFTQVMLPLLWPGIASGAIFAFLTSFDEIVIAMFVSGSNPTLPKLMFDGILYEQKAVYDPFTAATGIKIKQVSATNQLALLKAQVQNNSPEWDIIQPGSAWLWRGAQDGLYEKLDAGVVNRTEMYGPALHSHGIAFEV